MMGEQISGLKKPIGESLRYCLYGTLLVSGLVLIIASIGLSMSATSLYWEDIGAIGITSGAVIFAFSISNLIRLD